jgi:Zn-dependent membrane protease YugP
MIELLPILYYLLVAWTAVLMGLALLYAYVYLRIRFDPTRRLIRKLEATWELPAAERE